jgi:hypothetical protein
VRSQEVGLIHRNLTTLSHALCQYLLQDTPIKVPPWGIRENTVGSLFYNTYLDIRLGLVCHFHNEFGIGIDHVLQDALINTGIV